jgi:hypothetical protein
MVAFFKKGMTGALTPFSNLVLNIDNTQNLKISHFERASKGQKFKVYTQHSLL